MSISHQYPRTGKALFKVDIGEDGGIIVAKGDILGGYSMAIYGTPTEVNEYGRPNVGGELIPVQDPDKIYEGEVLYHLPSVDRLKWPPAEITGEISGPEIEVIFTRLLENADLPSSPVIARGVGWFFSGAGASLAVTESVAVAAGATIGAAALGVSAGLGAIGFIVGGMVAWLDAADTDNKNVATLGYVYGYTAWAYKHTPIAPPLSRKLRTRLSVPGSQSRIRGYIDAWDKSVKKAHQDAALHANTYYQKAQAELQKRGYEFGKIDPVLFYRATIQQQWKSPQDFYKKTYTELLKSMKPALGGNTNNRILKNTFEHIVYPA